MQSGSEVIYQIYPRSFFDTNGDGIGDLQGIIQKLDYIASLGVNTIWLSPVYVSPHEDFGYDIADYYHIDPLFGSDEDFAELIEKAHFLGLKIVMDMVMNHTSIHHPWFESSARREAPYTDWYIWHPGKGKRRPNNWCSMTGGSGWHFHPVRKEWFFASFLPFQPDLNYHHPAVRETMFGVAKYWLQKGVDGFRLDIFNVMIKDTSFKNNPFSLRPIPSETNPNGFFQEMKYTVNHPGNFELAEGLRAACREINPDAFLIGEVFGDTVTLRQYLGDGDGLNYVFLFEMLPYKLKADFFREKIRKFEQFFPAPYTPTYVFGNHDRIRPISRIGGDILKWKLVVLFQLTARGLPVIYMGEEIGMEQLRLPLKGAKDPFAIKYNWVPEWIAKKLPEALNRDGSRTPMQWDNSQNAGFSNAKAPWLPVHFNFLERNVAQQETVPDSLLNWYRCLLAYRKEFPVLQQGNIRLIDTSHENQVLAFSRNTETAHVIIYINFSSVEIQENIPEGYAVLASTDSAGLSVSGEQLLLPPWSGCLLSVTK